MKWLVKVSARNRDLAVIERKKVPPGLSLSFENNGKGKTD